VLREGHIRFLTHLSGRLLRDRALIAVMVFSFARISAALAMKVEDYFLEVGGTIEHAQAIANHESPKTTKLYDRTNDQITLDEFERLVI
jgi:integrase